MSEIEAFRVKAGAAPVSYVVADVDNRAGRGSINMFKVTAFDPEGKKYEFSRAYQFVSAWGPSYGSDFVYRLPDGTALDEAAGRSLNDQEVELHNSLLDDVAPAEHASIVLVSESPELPKEFTRVAVNPNGAGEQVEALPTSAGGHD
ncbi:hypothetical protein [Paenarthrobacter sp. TA1.8]|uniref:hypothetical protein n=1 Tax=Paenarthrobacter sp. TA1.8 TaxID=3400219 RepID=UPI003B434D49